ncbi:MAG TPA: hypothetical protein PLQ19_05500 [Aeromicrobium sp.]|nr:hypothetical protein [Aeromicrobium sp.]
MLDDHYDQSLLFDALRLAASHLCEHIAKAEGVDIFRLVSGETSLPLMSWLRQRVFVRDLDEPRNRAYHAAVLSLLSEEGGGYSPEVFDALVSFCFVVIEDYMIRRQGHVGAFLHELRLDAAAVAG